MINGQIRFALSLAFTFVLLAVAAARASANKDASKKSDASEQPPDRCVGDLPELVPDPISLEERAIEQEAACVVIVRADIPKCPVFEAAKAFCQDPLKAPPVTGADLARARAYADKGQCKIDEQGSRALSILPSSLQNDLLRGLAEFVVARAKAEAMAFLIGTLKQTVCNDQHAAELAVHTCAVLENAEPGKGTPPAWGTIKAAFEADIGVLPERAVACAAHVAKTAPDVRDLLVTGVQAAMLVRGGEDPLQVLAGLVPRFPSKKPAATPAGQQPPATDAGDRICKVEDNGKERVDYRCGLHMLGFAVRTLAPLGSDAELDMDPSRFGKIVTRRILDEAKAIGLVDDKTDAGVVALAEHAERLRARIRYLIDTVNTAREALKKLPPGANLQSGRRLAHAMVDVMSAALELVPDKLAGKQEILQTVRRYLAIVDELATAVDGAVDRDFATAFVHVTSAITMMGHKLPDPLLKYGAFIAEVASAKTSADVQHALESAAAPVGASLAKRGAGRHTAAITAFLGLHGGLELTSVSNGKTVTGWQGSLFAPIGIDLSKGIKEHQSIGLFVSAIDLGALTSLRTSDGVPAGGEITDGTKIIATPQVGFRQVVAPGLYFVYGIDRAAVGIGASMTPELREISKDGILIERDAALRIGIFAALDVTIFPF